MRVLTLNLWGQAGPWPERRTLLRNELVALRPDLVAFQETIVTGSYDQVADLMGPGYAIAHQTQNLATSDSDFRGASIASRWPIRDLVEVDLDLTPRARAADFPCVSLIATIEAPTGMLLFVNHLPSWQLDFAAEREWQAVATARRIDEIVADQRRPVVLAGDLDAAPDATSIRFWTGRQSLGGMSVCYRDAWESRHPDQPGFTFTPDNPHMEGPDWPFRRIDYVLVRSGEHRGAMLEIVDCRLVFDRPVDGIWASDHFGVVADLA